MKQAIPYTKRELIRLKPHTVVYHLNDQEFYEVRERIGGGQHTDVYRACLIIVRTGEVAKWRDVNIYRDDVEVVSPAHPIYLKWAARRLQDRLEGLDRP